MITAPDEARETETRLIATLRPRDNLVQMPSGAPPAELEAAPF